MYRRYKATCELPVQRRLGRRPRPATEVEVDLVLRYYGRYRLDACGLELAMARDGVCVPCNRIDAVLGAHGLAFRT